MKIIILLMMVFLSCCPQADTKPAETKESQKVTQTAWTILEESELSATMKMEVLGGWIVCHKWRSYDGVAIGMVFVADEKHLWGK